MVDGDLLGDFDRISVRLVPDALSVIA